MGVPTYFSISFYIAQLKINARFTISSWLVTIFNLIIALISQKYVPGRISGIVGWFLKKKPGHPSPDPSKNGVNIFRKFAFLLYKCQILQWSFLECTSFFGNVKKVGCRCCWMTELRSLVISRKDNLGNLIRK